MRAFSQTQGSRILKARGKAGEIKQISLSYFRSSPSTPQQSSKGWEEGRKVGNECIRITRDFTESTERLSKGWGRGAGGGQAIALREIA